MRGATCMGASKAEIIRISCDADDAFLGIVFSAFDSESSGIIWNESHTNSGCDTVTVRVSSAGATGCLQAICYTTKTSSTCCVTSCNTSRTSHDNARRTGLESTA